MSTREILFRGKRIDNGEWVDGHYAQLPKASLGATIASGGYLCAEDVGDYIIVNKPKQHSNFSNSIPLEVVECEWNEVAPETVCQYTGLTDKNGRKIFEGDIVKTKFFGKCNEKGQNFNDYDIFKIVYKYVTYLLENRSRHFSTSYIPNMHGSGIEVVGNIFDNPELLN